MSSGRKGRASLFSILALLLPWRFALWGEMEHVFRSMQVSNKKRRRQCPSKPRGHMSEMLCSLDTSFSIPCGCRDPGVPAAPAQLQPGAALFGQSSACACLPRKWKALPPPMCGPTTGSDVLRELGQPKAQPCAFLLLPLGFFSHLFGLWAPQGRGSSPEHAECSAQRYCKEKWWQWRRSICKPSQKEYCLFSPEKKNPTWKDFNSV